MLQFDNITKSFKKKAVLNNISFEVERGMLVAVIGESGCGKTTLLKMINRLIKPTSGKIYIKDQDIMQMDVIKLRRKIGYVIQQTGLFPHMTVRDNIEIIPKVEKQNKDAIAENTLKLMAMVGLNPDEYLDRYPTELSGGQQQRIGVARAFATDPEIILMDEPFSALDPMTRSDLQDELVELQAKLKKTIVFVTHDMDEAVKIADKICIMRGGKILQYDTPENILKNPADNYVSDFVGKNRIWASPEFIKVEDIMIENPVTTTMDALVFRCIDKMRQRSVDSLLVVDSDTKVLKGIVKAKMLRNLEDKQQAAANVMNTDFPKLYPHSTILDALKVVHDTQVSTVPIVDDKNVLKGLLTKSSLMTTLSEQYLDLEVV